MTMRVSRLVMDVALAATLLAASSAHAQFRARAVSLNAGARAFSGSGDQGTTLMAAVRSEFFLSRGLLWEASASLAGGVDGTRSSTFDLVEVLLQAATSSGGLETYVGAGAGVARSRSYGSSDPVATVGGGVRGQLSGGLGLVLDVRLRSIGFLRDNQSLLNGDFSVGLRHQFR